MVDIIKVPIVGNGPVGLLYLENWYNVAREFPQAKFQIDWYGRDEPFGTGIYNPKWFDGEANALILNVHSGDMGPRFAAFCEARGYGAESFPPRGVYGDFCAQDAAALIANPPENATIKTIVAEVNKYGRNSDGTHILGFGDNEVEDGYHFVCLALGHDWDSQRPEHLEGNPAFVEHPYAPTEFGQWLDGHNKNEKQLIALLGQGAGTIDALRWLEAHHQHEKVAYVIISKNAKEDFWWSYDWHKPKDNLPRWLTDGTVQADLCHTGGDQIVIDKFKEAEHAGQPVSHMLVTLNAYLDSLSVDPKAGTAFLQPEFSKLRNWSERRYGALTAPENVKLVNELKAKRRLYFLNVEDRISANLITASDDMLNLESVRPGLIVHGAIVTAPNCRSIADANGKIRNPLLASLQVPLTPNGLIKLDKRTGEIEGCPGVLSAGPMTKGTWGVETFGKQIEWSTLATKNRIRGLLNAGDLGYKNPGLHQAIA